MCISNGFVLSLYYMFTVMNGAAFLDILVPRRISQVLKLDDRNDCQEQGMFR